MVYYCCMVRYSCPGQYQGLKGEVTGVQEWMQLLERVARASIILQEMVWQAFGDLTN